jgi:hypothetical protein
MTRVLRLDTIDLDSTYWTKEGYLIDHPIVTSVGIFEYTNPDGSIRRELRLPEHVFDPESLESYRGKPVIITHNAKVVDKNNVDEEHVGTILSAGYRDGENVRAEIVVHETDVVKQSGLRALSLGYSLDQDNTPGEWNGQPYDLIQTNIRVNHLALVREARAGEEAHLNLDEKKGGEPVGKIRHDEFPVDDPVAAYKERRDRRKADGGEPPVGVESVPVEETKIDRAQMVRDRRDRRDGEGDPETPEAAMGVIAQQDEDIDSLLEVIEELQAKSDFGHGDESEEEENKNEDEDEEKTEEEKVNTDSIDRIVRTRVSLARIGDKLRLDGIETMSIMDAKKAIIKKVRPQIRLDGKSQAYVTAAFDLAVSEVEAKKDTDFQRRQMFNADSKTPEKTSAVAAREKMIARRNGGND